MGPADCKVKKTRQLLMPGNYTGDAAKYPVAFSIEKAF